MYKKLLTFIFTLVAFFTITPHVFASPSWTASSVTVDISKSRYSFNYSGYGGSLPLVAIALRTDENGTYLDNTDTSHISCSAGHCSGKFHNFNVGHISCSSGDLVLDMYDGSSEYFSYSVTPTYSNCYPTWTASGVTVNVSTGAYSFNYSGYGGSLPLAASAIRTDQYGTILDNTDTTPPSCSAGTCTGTFSNFNVGHINCNTGNVVLDMYDGNAEYWSYLVTPIYSGCSGWTASNISVNVSTGAYSFNYSGYGDDLPLAAIAFRTDQNGTYFDNTDTANLNCSAGTCTGILHNFNVGHISCSTGNVIIDLYDGTNETFSSSATPSYSGC